MKERVSEPIREYLSRREDTIRCVVSLCTDESNTELFEELANRLVGLLVGCVLNFFLQ